MTITAANFIVVNGAALDVANLNIALQYLQTSELATRLLGELSLIWVTDDKERVEIIIGHDRKDFVEAGNNKIYWDPNNGTVAINDYGVAFGVNSAALALLHEACHVLDPYRNDYEQYDDPSHPLYFYTHEGEFRVITQLESVVASQLGEVPR